MVVMFKRIALVGIAISSSVISLGSTADDDHDLDWYANAVQNVISYYGEDTKKQVMDLFGEEAAPVADCTNVDSEGILTFNDVPTNPELLEEQMEDSDSICLNGVDFGKQNGLATGLADVLLLIAKTGVDDQFIHLNMEYIPRRSSADCDIINIAPDGALSLAGKPVELSDLSGLLSEDSKVGIESDPKQPPPPFSRILTVVKAVGTQNIHHFFIANRRQILISAEIYQLSADGARDVLSAPRVTTQPGYSAAIRVVENASGQKPYKPELDEFHQEDLANLGIRFSVKPQIIGDHVRVSGVAILTKASDLTEAFQEVDAPVHSYTVNKTVAPFSVVLNSVNDGAEFPIAEVDGNKTRCRLTAVIVDEKGMSQADKDLARAATLILSTQTDLFESRSK